MALVHFLYHKWEKTCCLSLPSHPALAGDPWLVVSAPLPDTQKQLQEQRHMFSGYVSSDLSKTGVFLTKLLSRWGIQSPEVTSLYKGGLLFLFCCKLVYKSTNRFKLCAIHSVCPLDEDLGVCLWVYRHLFSLYHYSDLCPKPASLLASIICSGLLSVWGLLSAHMGAPVPSPAICTLSLSANVSLCPFMTAPRLSPHLHLCFTSGVCLPRETALFSVSAFLYPTVCIMPECLFASLHLCQIYFCLFLPWDPGGLGLRFLFLLCPGLEELVLSEMNSPSRTQTGDSSSVSSFSYREILREKESSTVPARVRGREEPTAPASTQILGPPFSLPCCHLLLWAQHTHILVKFSSSSQTWIQIAKWRMNKLSSLTLLHHLWANSSFPGAIKYVAHSRCIIHVGDRFFPHFIVITYYCCLCQLPCQTLIFGNNFFYHSISSLCTL